jgi:hypothetical protein
MRPSIAFRNTVLRGDSGQAMTTSRRYLRNAISSFMPVEEHAACQSENQGSSAPADDALLSLQRDSTKLTVTLLFMSDDRSASLSVRLPNPMCVGFVTIMSKGIPPGPSPAPASCPGFTIMIWPEKSLRMPLLSCGCLWGSLVRLSYRLDWLVRRHDRNRQQRYPACHG